MTDYCLRDVFHYPIYIKKIDFLNYNEVEEEREENNTNPTKNNDHAIVKFK